MHIVYNILKVGVDEIERFKRTIFKKLILKKYATIQKMTLKNELHFEIRPDAIRAHFL